jgi:hypothetical protein
MSPTSTSRSNCRRILGGRLYDRAALDAMLADAERVVTP